MAAVLGFGYQLALNRMGKDYLFYTKLDLRDRTQAATLDYEAGIVEPRT